MKAHAIGAATTLALLLTACGGPQMTGDIDAAERPVTPVEVTLASAHNDYDPAPLLEDDLKTFGYASRDLEALGSDVAAIATTLESLDADTAAFATAASEVASTALSPDLGSLGQDALEGTTNELVNSYNRLTKELERWALENPDPAAASVAHYGD